MHLSINFEAFVELFCAQKHQFSGVHHQAAHSIPVLFHHMQHQYKSVYKQGCHVTFSHSIVSFSTLTFSALAAFLYSGASA